MRHLVNNFLIAFHYFAIFIDIQLFVVVILGNAKTIRNDNSSRFGKFMQVCFDNRWCIKGCIIQDYLLEQSRITFQSPGERNYHVLYQFAAEGQMNHEFAKQYKIRDPKFYRYLNGGDSSTGESVDVDVPTEAKKFEALRLAFSVLQIPESLIDGILKVMSAILWLGNLDFVDVDGEKCDLTDLDKEIVSTVIELLGIQETELIQVLLMRQINVRGNITEIPLKLPEARENRNSVRNVEKLTNRKTNKTHNYVQSIFRWLKLYIHVHLLGL